MKIILICGVIGSGKDYLAKRYIKDHPQERVKLLKFATSLRDLTEGIYNLPKGDDAAYEAFKAIPENRMFMVRLGENLKRVYGDDFLAFKVIDDIFDNKESYDTFIVSDFRFPVEFWSFYKLFERNTHRITILFADYHSERYTIAPEQVSERMAIWLKEQGLKDRQEIGGREFAELIDKYEEK